MTHLSYQLYSSREFPPLSDTLAMLGRLGYDEVEGFGGVYADPAALADELGRHGLTMSSGHFSLDMLENDPAKAIGIARATGMKAVFCPHVGPDLRPADAAGWRAFGERLQKAGEPVRAAGLAFGWHNHDFEFAALPDGTVPMEEILAGGPDLAWEADIAWIVRGGGDPLDWIDRHGGRILAVHVKDIAPEGECADEDGWADVGHGTIDWKAIWQKLGEKTSASIFVMEHDKPNDHERFARRSIESVRALGDI
ncbi:MAG: sugar phosphate isomerase/epimerase [Pseudomonadota bacterium]|nr:sugar phosphate isomerase/epimerase [Pseudomonadota bacterium]